MGFEDDPAAVNEPDIGRVFRPATEVMSRMGGVSSLNQGDAPLTKSQKDAKRIAENVRFGTFSRKGQ
jgi:hypothetical protein